MSDDIIKQGTGVDIEFHMKVPADCTIDELHDWLMYQLGARSEMASSSPLADFPIESDAFIRWNKT